MLDELGISNEQLSGGSRRGAPLGDIRFVTIQYTGSRKGKRCPLITRAKTQCLPILYIIYPYAQILPRILLHVQLLPPNCFLFSLYQKTDNVSCRIFDITARKIGGGGIGIFFIIYTKNGVRDAG